MIVVCLNIPHFSLHHIRLFDEEGGSSTVDLSEVYDHLSFAEFKLGNIKRAAHYTRVVLQNGQLLELVFHRYTLYI